MPLAIVIVFLFGLALAGPAWQLVGLIGGNDWGSDWLWLEDGLHRLAAREPLTRPEYLAGPFSQFTNGPAYTWSLHPPSNATLSAPMLLLPAELRQAGWAWLMAAALFVAVWLAWPRRLWWGTHLLVAAAVLGPPLGAVSLGVVDQLHFANPNAVVVLGVVLAWIGRRRGSAILIAAGLVLLSVKIVPAVSVGCWLLAGPDRSGTGPVRRGIAFALVGLASLTIPVLLLDPGAVADTLAAQLNLVPWDGPPNLAPQVRLAPIVGATAAAIATKVIGVGLLVVMLVRRLNGPGGLLIAAGVPLLLTPQLWAHWFLIPALAILIAAGEWPTLRVLDGRLRAAWEEASRSHAHRDDRLTR